EITTADVTRLATSKSPLWFTPSEILEDARIVLEEIDLDPASDPETNPKAVKALHIYTEADDGLDPKNEWRGRVWLNPPYLGLAGPFVHRLIHEYSKCSVNSAIRK